MPGANGVGARPNIVYIMADDVGYGDVGCYNAESRIPTPNLDRLAGEGLRLTDAHSPAAVCTPTRYGVLTGRYCWRSRLRARVLFSYERPLIEPTRLTLPLMLKSAGYATAAVGKWHLGVGYSVKRGEYVDFEAPLPWDMPTRTLQEKIDFTAPVWGGPTALGFDQFFGTAGSSTHQPPYGFIEGDRFVVPPSEYYVDPRDGKPGIAKAGMMAPGWDAKEVDTTFAGKAVEFIEAQRGSEQPFFLYLTSSAAHEPCTEDVVPVFARGQSAAGPRGDLVWLFDWMVGQVLEALERTGQAENTLVIVTSDNGALPGDRMLVNGREVYRMYGHKACGDWRGYKAHIWEGGHREPFIVRWPGRVAAGTVSDALFGLTDVMATLAAVVGVDLPHDAAEDSLNLLPVWLSERPEPPLRQAIVHHSGAGVYSIRDGAWKLILDTQGSGGWPPPAGGPPTPGTPGQLYNLDDDPWERQNLWEVAPETVERLRGMLWQYRENGRSVPARLGQR